MLVCFLEAGTVCSCVIQRMKWSLFYSIKHKVSLNAWMCEFFFTLCASENESFSSLKCQKFDVLQLQPPTSRVIIIIWLLLSLSINTAFENLTLCVGVCGCHEIDVCFVTHNRILCPPSCLLSYAFSHGQGVNCAEKYNFKVILMSICHLSKGIIHIYFSFNEVSFVLDLQLVCHVKEVLVLIIF